MNHGLVATACAFSVVACTAFSAAKPDIAYADLALHGVNIVRVETGDILSDQTVCIADGKFIAIRPDRDAPCRAKKNIEASGEYLMPGLWDMHVHLSKAREVALPLLVASGVTSVRDVCGDFEELKKWKAEIATGERVGPTMYIVGPCLESPETVERQLSKNKNDVEPYARTRWPVGTPEEARKTVDRIADGGADLIKVRTVKSGKVFAAIVRAAHKRNLKVATHANYLTMDDAAALKVGSVEHLVWVDVAHHSPDQQIAAGRKLAEAGVFLTPTLVPFEYQLDHEPKEFADLLDHPPANWDHPRNLLSAYLVADWREQIAERTFPLDDLRKFFVGQLEAYKRLKAAGVVFLAGTDLAVLGVYPGEGLHRELELLVMQLGLSNAEALRAATIDPARFFNRQADAGSIAEGKIADAVLLHGNPITNIANTKSIAAVILRGRYLDGDALTALKREVTQSPVLKINDWKK